jgi:hypothetical protein
MGSYRDAAWYPAAAALAGRSRAMASHGRQSREAMRRSRAQRCNGVRCMPPLTGCGFVCCSYAQPAHPSGRPRAARSAPCHSAARSCCPTPTLGNEMPAAWADPMLTVRCRSPSGELDGAVVVGTCARRRRLLLCRRGERRLRFASALLLIGTGAQMDGPGTRVNKARRHPPWVAVGCAARGACGGVR